MINIEIIKINAINNNYIYEELYDYIISNLEILSNEWKTLNGDQIKVGFFNFRDILEDSLIIFLIEKNQYVYIDNKFKKLLKSIYNKYLVSIIKFVISKDLLNLENNFKKMDEELKLFLNEFEEIKKIDDLEDNIPNYEYSMEEQLKVLNINNIEQPVLDLGCGKNFYLVEGLINKKIETYGIDRYNFDESFLKDISWLEFDYEKEKFGTIIAHMSFSNHFIRENLKQNGNYIEYANTYMKILESLKIGGSFYYSPDLEFIERLLDKNLFEIRYKELENGYKSVQIKKIKI